MLLLPLLLMALASTPPHIAHAELFPVSDAAYPHIVISEPGTVPVVWHKKFVAFRYMQAAHSSSSSSSSPACSAVLWR